MPATPYRAISWAPYELVSEEKMNQTTNNVQWVFEHTPRVLYTTPGLQRDTGVRIACGRVAFNKSKNDSDTETIHFNNFFSRRCQPVVTTGIISNGQKKIFAVAHGISGLHPNNQGFRLSVNIAAEGKKNDKISKQFYVHWIAMGY